MSELFSNIPSNTSKFITDKIQEFSKYYDSLPNKIKKVMESPEVLKGVQKRKKDEKTVYTWCEKFYSNFTTGSQIIEFINVADALEHPILLNLAYAIMAKEIETLSLDQFRDKYNIENDLEPDEINQLNNEEDIYKNSS